MERLKLIMNLLYKRADLAVEPAPKGQFNEIRTWFLVSISTQVYMVLFRSASFCPKITFTWWSFFFFSFSLRFFFVLKSIWQCPYSHTTHAVMSLPQSLVNVFCSNTQLQSQFSPFCSALGMSRQHINGPSLQKTSSKLSCTMACKRYHWPQPWFICRVSPTAPAPWCPP